MTDDWKRFEIAKADFDKIVEDFAECMDDGLNGRESCLQMLPSYAGRPEQNEKGTYLALDFGGTNIRVAEVELAGSGRARIRKLHAVSLRDANGAYDLTSADTHVEELFGFIARQVAMVATGAECRLGHSFSYASRQTSLARAALKGWAKEIKVTGLAGQDINGMLQDALLQLKLDHVHPVAVLNDTTATLLAAAYARQEADLGSVCGTGHNTCYYESDPPHGTFGVAMAYNAESGGFDKLPFTAYDQQLDAESEAPGRQRLEKMVAGRYLGELVRRILRTATDSRGKPSWADCQALWQTDGLSSIDVSTFTGDPSPGLDRIGEWFAQQRTVQRLTLAERLYVKAVAEQVVTRAASLIAASYAGFLRRMDPGRRNRHVIGINGSLFEKMPGFAEGIRIALAANAGWKAPQIEFFMVREAPLVGAAVAAAMATGEAG